MNYVKKRQRPLIELIASPAGVVLRRHNEEGGGGHPVGADVDQGHLSHEDERAEPWRFRTQH